MSRTRASKDTCTEIANRIAQMLEQGVAPWRRPWSVAGAMPTNALTGKAYRGINVLAIFAEQLRAGYTEARWLTYKQAIELGGHVRRGERGTRLVLWKRTERRVETEDGEDETRRSLVARTFTVFNVEQCEGLELAAIEAHEHDPVAAAEELVAGYLAGGPALHQGGAEAYYVPGDDLVVVPPMSAFADVSEYYSTLFHELGHSTGHQSRLARDLGPLAGVHAYSREELVAEFCAAFLCGLTGVSNDASLANSAAYLKGWAAKLREEPKVLLWAASRAQKAVDFIVSAEASAIAA